MKAHQVLLRVGKPTFSPDVFRCADGSVFEIWTYDRADCRGYVIQQGGLLPHLTVADNNWAMDLAGVHAFAAAS